jgi:hypothetical protein
MGAVNVGNIVTVFSDFAHVEASTSCTQNDPSVVGFSTRDFHAQEVLPCSFAASTFHHINVSLSLIE